MTQFWGLVPIEGMVIIIILAVIIYFVPTFIAFIRRKKQFWAIFVINLCLGWTGIGWIGALFWAVFKEISDGG